MPPRKAPTSRGSANGESSSTTTLSTSNSHPHPVVENVNSSGMDMSMHAGERTGDDQQISQILAEMAQQNTQHQPQLQIHHSEPVTNRPTRTARSRRTPALDAPGSPDETLNLPNISSTYDSTISPSSASAPLPGSSNSRPNLNRQHQQQEATQAEQDELDNSGEGEGGAGVAASATSETSAKGKTRDKKGEKRARGNGNEHKGMTEEEWERSRKANHKEVERRRRETINAGLDSLAALLPPAPTPPEGATTSQGRGNKPNKSEILGRGIEYIQQLRQEKQADLNKWTLDKLLKDQEIKKIQTELDKTKEANEVLKKRIEELERGLSNGGNVADLGEGGNKKRRIDGEASKN
ncbi:hypothetical protein JCM5350_001607 [Sporobolomyces pararoseus]